VQTLGLRDSSFDGIDFLTVSMFSSKAIKGGRGGRGGGGGGRGGLLDVGSYFLVEYPGDSMIDLVSYNDLFPS
jgi:hypothetical protein